jgi:hypothetical protein
MLHLLPSRYRYLYQTVHIKFNPLTPNDLKRRRTVSYLKIKIPSKNMREKPTNTPIIHSVYKCTVQEAKFPVKKPRQALLRGGI